MESNRKKKKNTVPLGAPSILMLESMAHKMALNSVSNVHLNSGTIGLLAWVFDSKSLQTEKTLTHEDISQSVGGSEG